MWSLPRGGMHACAHHGPMLCPLESDSREFPGTLGARAKTGSMYLNYKGTFSFGSSCSCGCPVFLPCDRCWGGYGRTSDGGVLANSAFGQALRSGTLQLPADMPLPGADHRGPQPHLFVANETFPLCKNLMRPFPGCRLPQERQILNYHLSLGRLVVECAFGILSSQWRVYRRPMEVHPNVAEDCVKATCVLQNFLWRTTQTPAVRTSIPVAISEVEPLPGLGRIAANNSAREAARVRETLTSFFSAEEAVHTKWLF